ncbi:MAG: 2,5-didehydrogluconate reductase DkgB, partial [Polaromonas sp.]|nr:2,5-didehydrogluconate reductase DkgB [Polaromonas sp.]
MNLPPIGLGTFRLEGQQAIASVGAALDIGYRLIDTAQMYNNEVEVGRALAASRVPRSEVFVTTKIWPDNFTRLIPSLKESLERLQMQQVDLTLLHWPAPGSGVPLEHTLAALMEARAAGLTRQIGLSNFNIALMTRAIAIAGKGQIATNQVELSPYLHNLKVADFASREGIRITSYMTLARGLVLDDRSLGKIAQRHGATTAQVALAWAMRLGHTVIPSSTQPANLQSNFEALKLSLSEADMAQIARLDKG